MRDVLVLYALVVEVFAYFNASTAAIFKKKPPELAKPLLAEVKRAVQLQYGVAPSRPTSAAASGPAPAAAAGALPPIGRRWMKSAEFANFAYALVTEKFHAADDLPPATPAATGAGADSRPGTAASIPATPIS